MISDGDIAGFRAPSIHEIVGDIQFREITISGYDFMINLDKERINDQTGTKKNRMRSIKCRFKNKWHLVHWVAGAKQTLAIYFFGTSITPSFLSASSSFSVIPMPVSTLSVCSPKNGAGDRLKSRSSENLTGNPI